MPRHHPLDQHLRDLVILASEAPGFGLTRGRLRAADVAHPFHNVYVLGAAPSTVLNRARAFEPLLRHGDAFSHTTAALLWGGQLPSAIASDPHIHVISTAGAASDRFRRVGVSGHLGSGFPVALAHELPTVAPAANWLQMASVLTRDDLIALGDRLVTPLGRRGATRPALVQPGELSAAITANAGCRGAARARRALPLVRVGPLSRMETRLRLLLVAGGLPEPIVAPPMTVGGVLLHPDLAYPQWRVVFEYEGDVHRTDPVQWRHDIWRREAFESAGERVIRVHKDDVLTHPERFLARVRAIIAQRERERERARIAGSRLGYCGSRAQGVTERTS